MDDRPRILERKARALTTSFGAVLVTGPRQAGKTSLLTHLAQEMFGTEVRAVSFDTPSEIGAFRRDPERSFANNPGLLFLDEVQHVPDIFPYLKREIDRARGVFRFLLSGSQHFELMKGVTESLAGRTAILDLWPFSVQEVKGQNAEAAVRTVEILRDPVRLDPPGFDTILKVVGALGLQLHAVATQHSMADPGAAADRHHSAGR